MNVLIVFTLTLILTAASAFNSGGNEVVPRGRVSNGTGASRGQFPFMVALLIQRSNSTYTSCGGTLISNKWILTAAHCLINVAEVTVYLDTIDFENPRKVIVVRPQHIFSHDYFKPTGKENDIALIKVPAINFTVNINAANLPNEEKANYTGQTAVIAGWGSTNGNRTHRTIYNPSRILQWGQVKVITTQSCRSAYKMRLPNDIICTESIDDVEILIGDSGGPLMLVPENIVIGVDSLMGRRPNMPSIYSSVVEYLPWIKQIMDSN